jgi:hypothetical protein
MSLSTDMKGWTQRVRYFPQSTKELCDALLLPVSCQYTVLSHIKVYLTLFWGGSCAARYAGVALQTFHHGNGSWVG